MKKGGLLEASDIRAALSRILIGSLLTQAGLLPSFHPGLLYAAKLVVSGTMV
jgi:hypothetical protein